MSRVARVRIRNVRPKAENVLVLQNPRLTQSRETAAKLVQHARMLSDQFPDDMAGFVVIAWDHKGRWSNGARYDRSFMSEGMAIEFVRSCLLRRLTEDDTIERLGYDPEVI